jgi:hypothetical protein
VALEGSCLALKMEIPEQEIELVIKIKKQKIKAQNHSVKLLALSFDLKAFIYFRDRY